MNDRVLANKKTSVTPPVATPASSPLLRRQLTEEVSESVGSNSNISKELGGIQRKTIRRSLNWQNITVEAPNRAAASSASPGGIQRLETSEVKEQEESKEQQNKELVQTKLTVGAPGDKYEQEADSMAAKVMTMPDSAIKPPIQRQTGEDTEAVQMQPLVNSITPVVQRESGEEEEVQMKSQVQRASDGSSVASGNVENQIASSKGGGSALPDDVRSYMEPRFGADFSSVRVHTDSNAVQMNKELGAQAFAHGSDIYYGAGKSPGKNELTAHELTHTIQQTGAAQLNKSVLPKPEPEQEEKQPLQAKKLSSSTPEVIQNKLGTGIAPRIQANQQRQSTEPSQFSTAPSELISLERTQEGGSKQPQSSVHQQLISSLSNALGELGPERTEKACKDTLVLEEKDIKRLVISAGSWNQVRDNYVKYTNLMKQIIGYRERVVLNIGLQVTKSDPKDTEGSVQTEREIVPHNNPVKMVAAGSSDLESDYDITFSAGAGNEKLESCAVREFNKLFRKEWTLESGIVFDTNVYTSGHMRSEAAFKGEGNKLGKINKLLEDLKKIRVNIHNYKKNNGKNPDYKADKEAGAILKKRDEINDSIKIINGLGSEGIRIALPLLEVDLDKPQKNNIQPLLRAIAKVQPDLTETVDKQYNESKNDYGAGPEFDELAMVMSLVHMKEFWGQQPQGSPNWTDFERGLTGDNVPDNVKTSNEGRLERTSKIHTELVTEREDKMKQAEEQLRQEKPELANNKVHIEMRANNLLYEEYLVKIDEKRDEVRKAEEKLKAAEKSGEQSTKALEQEVNALKFELQELQSKAMFFANEAYMTAIAAEQVVLNQQLGLGIELPTAQYLASINEQTAFVGEQIGHLHANFGKALWKTAKYVDRILLAIKTISDQTLELAPTKEIKEKVDKLKPLATTLIDDIKKNSKLKGDKKDTEAKNLAEKTEENSSLLGRNTIQLARNILNLVIDVNISVQSHLSNLSRNSNQ